MDLCSDAQGQVPSSVGYLPERSIDLNILFKIEDDLDDAEQISVVFLMINNYTTQAQCVLDIFHNEKNKKQPHIITEFIRKTSRSQWEGSFLEALCVIQNNAVIRKLGIPLEEAKRRYCGRVVGVSLNINKVAKALYFLCESLGKADTQKLLESVREDGFRGVEDSNDPPPYLELHVLQWIRSGYISISWGNGSQATGDMRNLLKHLKKFEIDAYFELEKYKTPATVCYNSDCNRSGVTNGIVETGKQDARSTSSVECRIKTGRCLIVNQMHFPGTRYETRFGTENDCKRLEETFAGLGFQIEIIHDSKAGELLDRLKKIPTEYEINYDCFVLCILSHGYKGGVISSDGRQVSVDTIERTVCDERLKDVLKLVIIQACQGTNIGANDGGAVALGSPRSPLNSAENETEHNRNAGASDTNLDVDGPVQLVTPYDNFLLFQSTMKGFVAMRDKTQGSWFIQTLCDVFISESGKASVPDICVEVTKNLRQRTGYLNGRQAAQLPEVGPMRVAKRFFLPFYTPALMDETVIDAPTAVR